MPWMKYEKTMLEKHKQLPHWVYLEAQEHLFPASPQSLLMFVPECSAWSNTFLEPSCKKKKKRKKAQPVVVKEPESSFFMTTDCYIFRPVPSAQFSSQWKAIICSEDIFWTHRTFKEKCVIAYIMCMFGNLVHKLSPNRGFTIKIFKALSHTDRQQHKGELFLKDDTRRKMQRKRGKMLEGRINKCK